MTSTSGQNPSGQSPAAGWYADPAGTDQLRWWDGSAWSAHVAPKPVSSPTPVVQQAAYTPAPQVQQSTNALPPVVLHSDNALPPVVASTQYGTEYGAASPHDFAQPAQWNTFGAWVLAFWQVFYLITIVLFLLVDGTALVSNPQAIAGSGILGTSLLVEIALYVLGILFAAMDRRKLRSFGFLQPASFLWMLLFPPLLYLILRGVAMRREIRHGFGPLIAYLISYAVIVLVGVGSAILIPTLLAGSASSATSAVFTEGLEKGLDSNGGSYIVVCPPLVSMTTGSTFTCTATDTANNTPHAVRIQIVPGNDGEPTGKILSVTPAITR